MGRCQIGADEEDRRQQRLRRRRRLLLQLVKRLVADGVQEVRHTKGHSKGTMEDSMDSSPMYRKDIDYVQ